MQVSELLRKYIDIIQNEDVPPVSAKNWQDDPNTLDQKLSPTADLNDPNKADAKGKIVGRNRQLAYMQPLDKDGDLNVSLGLGKPQMRNLHGKGQSAVLTVGGNPGDKKNFAGVQLSQPLSKDQFGQRQGPGISAVFRKTF
jgi:hypothetical protein